MDENRYVKRGNQECKLFKEAWDKCPYVVAFRLGGVGVWRPLCRYDNYNDAYSYFEKITC